MSTQEEQETTWESVVRVQADLIDVSGRSLHAEKTEKNHSARLWFSLFIEHEMPCHAMPWEKGKKKNIMIKCRKKKTIQSKFSLVWWLSLFKKKKISRCIILDSIFLLRDLLYPIYFLFLLFHFILIIFLCNWKKLYPLTCLHVGAFYN